MFLTRSCRLYCSSCRSPGRSRGRRRSLWSRPSSLPSSPSGCWSSRSSSSASRSCPPGCPRSPSRSRYLPDKLRHPDLNVIDRNILRYSKISIFQTWLSSTLPLGLPSFLPSCVLPSFPSPHFPLPSLAGSSLPPFPSVSLHSPQESLVRESPFSHLLIAGWDRRNKINK